jgi:hypothetical protein
MVNPQKSVRKRRIAIAAVILTAYLTLFGLASMNAFVTNRSYLQHQKMLVSEGNSLYVGVRELGRTYQQPFLDQPLIVNNSEAWADMFEDTFTIFANGKEIKRKVVGETDWIWSSGYESVFFLQSSDDEDPPNKNIWKWSPKNGFVCLTKKPQKFFNMTLSLDGRSLSAMTYEAGGYGRNSMFSCSIFGASPKRIEFGKANFRPTMLGQGDYLLEADDWVLSKTFASIHTHVFRWKTGFKKSVPFVVEGRTVRSALAVKGSVWVLFQEPVYRWYPWMVKREDDKVTVAKLSPDLKRIEHQSQLRPEF